MARNPALRWSWRGRGSGCLGILRPRCQGTDAECEREGGRDRPCESKTTRSAMNVHGSPCAWVEFLEGIAPAELDETLIARRGRDNSGSCGAADRCGRVAKAGMVQCVESFQTKLEASILLNGKHPAYSQVEDHAIRPAEYVAARVAEGARGWNSKTGWVEPFRDSAIRQCSIAYPVRASGLAEILGAGDFRSKRLSAVGQNASALLPISQPIMSRAGAIDRGRRKVVANIKV